MLELYDDEGFAFCTRNGTPMTMSNVPSPEHASKGDTVPDWFFRALDVVSTCSTGGAVSPPRLLRR